MSAQTDRELLELAAKAAGIDGEMQNDDIGFWVGGDEGRRHGNCWNPLTDDGYALRLAVKLAIDVRFGSDEVHALYNSPWRCVEPLRHDRAAATRRAITRAAAAIAAATGQKGDA